MYQHFAHQPMYYAYRYYVLYSTRILFMFLFSLTAEPTVFAKFPTMNDVYKNWISLMVLPSSYLFSLLLTEIYIINRNARTNCLLVFGELSTYRAP